MTDGSRRVGIISDTHGLYRESVGDVFTGVELIVHAGDVGGQEVLDRLQGLAPIAAVFGNVDDPHHPQLAAARRVSIGDLRLRVSHGHELGSPTPSRVADAYADGRVDVLVFGHTHRSLVMCETRHGRPLWIVNPGSAGPRRFHLPASVAVMTVTGAHVDIQVVEVD